MFEARHGGLQRVLNVSTLNESFDSKPSTRRDCWNGCCPAWRLGSLLVTALVLRAYILGQVHYSNSELACCDWSPCSSTQGELSKELDRTYHSLGEYYAKNRKAGLPNPILTGGQARHLYVHGHLDLADSDIDLEPAESQAGSGTYGFLLDKVRPKISFVHKTSGNSSTEKVYGTCECMLPNGMPFRCLADIRGYLKTKYGISWWVDIPHMKRSILVRKERGPKWVLPALHHLRALDKDHNGFISALELTNQSCRVTKEHISQTALELTDLLQYLSDLERANFRKDKEPN